MALIRGSALLAGVALAVALSACGSESSSSGPGSGSGSPEPAAPTVTIHLAAGYSPDTVRLKAGEQFLLIVSEHVQASGVPVPGGCPPGTQRPVAGGLLSVQCMSHGRYLYTAKQAGSTTLSASVRPRCKPGTMCPQWITQPSLKLTIT